MAKRAPNLRRAFLFYNRKYFNNLLPTDAGVAWESMDSRLLGYMDYTNKRIRINAKLRDWKQQWRQTLLHEMTHMALPKRVEHGPRFQAEMRRLAKEGAFDDLW